MNKYFRRTFIRNDNKEIFLYGYKEHKEAPDKQLEIKNLSKPHMRWHPFRQEWVTYSPGRENRISFPSKDYCPLCPSAKIGNPTEVPFKNFEIAVFPNRWSSFNSHNENFILENVKTEVSNGVCEVIVYSDKHEDTVAEMSLERIELLIHAWIDRYKELLSREDVKYVMPFENRGEECGVTLHHPHGQIYSYPFIPPVIKKEIQAFNEKNYLLEIMNKLEDKYCVFKNDDMVAAVPPFARYSYEVWIIPKKQVPGPWEFNESQLTSYAECLKKVIKGYDSFLKKKCPYIMGLHAAAELKNDKFHFHTEFYPPLRSGEKPKILAGSESLAGVFIMDVLPEESAKILRDYMN